MMDRASTPARTLADTLLIGVFLAAIVLPVAGNVFELDAGATLSEKRRLAPPPDPPPDMTALRAFPRQFEAYWNDAFGWRNTLIRWYGIAELSLGVSPSSQVLLGKDGWLFYAGQQSVDSYRGLRPFTPTELAQWQALLEARAQWLAERGICYLFVIAPSKETIYPEFMPDVFNHVGPTRLDQLLAHLRAHSALAILDLRPALRAEKNQPLLYHHTDTHWNDLGAFIAYEEITRRLGAWFPGVAPMPRPNFKYRRRRLLSGDLADMLSLPELFTEPPLRLSGRLPRSARRVEGEGMFSHWIYETDHAPLPRAVMFHDSFATSLAGLLSEHFSRIAYYWQDGFDAAVIERERPQVVIQEHVERFLMTPVPIDPPRTAVPPSRLDGALRPACLTPR